MKKINLGYTNNSYVENDLFIQKKNQNGLNHKTNYEQLSCFNFVPKLIYNDDKISKWKLIDGQVLSNPTDENIIKLANILKELHNSKVSFAKFNLRKRVDTYRKIMNEKNIKIDVINDLYKKINLILKNMDHSYPVHGDLYESNILKTKNNEIFLVDWEYSHMGDKHYELAYWIESSHLTKKQEKLFLETYGDYDEHILKKHKVFVNYLTILWLHAQPVMFFSDKDCINRLKQLISEGF